HPSPWSENGSVLSVGLDCSAGSPRIVGEFDSAGSGEGAIVTGGGQTLVNGFAYDAMASAAVAELVTSQVRWRRNANPDPAQGPLGCVADCDGNGELDFFDFLCFQNDFAADSCEADCDGSGVLDFFDFLCFQNEFSMGCPDLSISQYSVEPPPSVDCGSVVTPFALDPRALGASVTTAASPLGGELTFDVPLIHRRVGSGWANWSHGYDGDVYFTQGR